MLYRALQRVFSLVPEPNEIQPPPLHEPVRLGSAWLGPTRPTILNATSGMRANLRVHFHQDTELSWPIEEKVWCETCRDMTESLALGEGHTKNTTLIFPSAHSVHAQYDRLPLLQRTVKTNDEPLVGRPKRHCTTDLP